MNDSDSRREPEESDSPGKSRVDREIEEILARSDSVRASSPRDTRLRGPSAQTPLNGPSPSISDMLAQWRSRPWGSPLLLGLVAGILAFVVADSSPLLANVFAFVAVALVFQPIVHRYRNQTMRGTKMWRGQVMDPRLDQSSPISQLRRWWSSQQR